MAIDKLKAAGHSKDDIDVLEGGLAAYNDATTPAERKEIGLGLKDELEKLHAKTPVKAPLDPAQKAAIAQAKQGRTPSFAEVPGGVKSAWTPEAYQLLRSNLYTGDVGTVAFKETIQNSVDAIRHLGSAGEVSANLDTDNKVLTIKDNGHGVTPANMKKAFIDIGESFKESGSSGGYGVAKVAYLANAKDIDVTSVSKRADGHYIRTTLKGTGESLFNAGVEPAKITVEDMGKGYTGGTGTDMKLQFYPDTKLDSYPTHQFAQGFGSTHLLKGKLSLKVNDYDLAMSRTEDDYDHAATLEAPGASVDIHTSKEKSDYGYSKVFTLNNGLPQFEKSMYMGKNLDVPARILVDIRANVGVMDPDYPFTLSREETKAEVGNLVDKYISDDLVSDAHRKQKGKYNKILHGGHDVGALTLVDSTNSLPDELHRSAADVLDKTRMAGRLDTVHLKISMELSKYSDKYKEGSFHGFAISGEKYYGVNVPAEYGGRDKNNNFILLDPFALAQKAATEAKLLEGDFLQNWRESFASSLVSTMIHEITHQKERNEAEGFTGEITANIGRLRKQTSGWIEDVLASFTQDNLDKIYAKHHEIREHGPGNDILRSISQGHGVEPTEEAHSNASGGGGDREGGPAAGGAVRKGEARGDGPERVPAYQRDPTEGRNIPKESIAPNYTGLSATLKELHSHPGRGFDSATRTKAIDSYLDRLLDYAKANHSNAVEDAQQAVHEYDRGNMMKAMGLSETALSRMHENETAAYKKALKAKQSGPGARMSATLVELHDHPVRKVNGGLGVSSEYAVNNYLSRLEDYAKDAHPDVLHYVDSARAYYDKGDYRNATKAAESALTRMHSAEQDGSSEWNAARSTGRPGTGNKRPGHLNLGGPGRPGSPQARATSAVQSALARVAHFLPTPKSGGRYHATAVIDAETAELIHTRSNARAYADRLADQSLRRVTAGLSEKEQSDLAKFLVSNQLQLDNPSHPAVLSEREMARIWRNPKTQAALLEHNRIQPELFTMRKKQTPSIKKKIGLEYTTAGKQPGLGDPARTGEDLFISLVAKKDAAGNPVKIASTATPSRSPRRQMVVQGSRFARPRAGSALEYETDLGKIYQESYRNALPGAITHDIYQGMKNKGIGIITKPGQKPPPTVNYNGIDYPALTETYRTGPVKKNGKVVGSVDLKISFPAQIHADLKDATGQKPFARRTFLDAKGMERAQDTYNEAQAALTDVQLSSPRVVTGHALRVLSLVTAFRDPHAPAARRILDTLLSVPTLRVVPRLTKLYDLANLDPTSTVETISKEGYAYSNASIRADLAKHNVVDNSEFDRTSKIGATPGVKQMRDFGHSHLFSEPQGKSELFNARTPSQLVKALHDFGLDIRAKVMVEKIRRMADGYDPNDPKLGDKMRGTGYGFGQYIAKPSRFVEMMKLLNRYAGTSAPMRVAELQQVFGSVGMKGKALSPAQRAAWRTETVFNSVAGSLMGYMLLNSLASGHMPWDNKADNTIELGNGYHISMSDADPAAARAMTTLGLLRAGRGVENENYMDIPRGTAKGVIGSAIDLGVGPGVRMMATAAGVNPYLIDPSGNAILLKAYPGAQFPLPDGDTDTYAKRGRAVLGEINPLLDTGLDVLGSASDGLSALRSPKDKQEIDPWSPLWMQVKASEALFNQALVQPDKQPRSSGALPPEVQKYIRQFEGTARLPR